MNVVSILGVIGIFFFPITMVIFIVWFKSKERRQRYRLQAELYTKALEKGQSVPPELFSEPIKTQNPLNIGIICIAVGIGVSLFLWLVSDAEEISNAAIGIIPFLVGVAYVIIHFIKKKKEKNEDAK